MPHLALPSYDPALGLSKKNLHLHQARRRGLLRRWRCDWCGKRCDKRGCVHRRAALTTFLRRADAEELRRSAQNGHLFTPTEAHDILASEETTMSRSSVGSYRQWASPYPVDVESVIA